MCGQPGCTRCFEFWLQGLMVVLTGYERDDDRDFWWKADLA